MLLIGAAVVGAYILTRPTIPISPYGINPATGLPYVPAGLTYPQTALNYYNPTGQSNLAQDIASGGTAAGGLSQLVDSISAAFS